MPVESVAMKLGGPERTRQRELGTVHRRAAVIEVPRGYSARNRAGATGPKTLDQSTAQPTRSENAFCYLEESVLAVVSSSRSSIALTKLLTQVALT
jgi:hypothetical protein